MIRAILILVLLVGCREIQQKNLANEFEESAALTQSAFFDLGAQVGAQCGLAYAFAVQQGITPLDTQFCIKEAKREYWEEHRLGEVVTSPWR